MSSSPDIGGTDWQVNVHKFVAKAAHLDVIVRLGTMTKQAATSLDAGVASGLNVLVAGARRQVTPQTLDSPLLESLRS